MIANIHQPQNHVLMDRPMYIPEDAARVTYAQLTPPLSERLDENDVYTILEMKFLADDEDVGQTIRMCRKQGLEITEEEVQEVLKAEEVYLREIGVII